MLLSISDNNGNAVYTNITVKLFSFGIGYLSESISLEPGSYELTKFVVLSNNQSLYASPVEGSSLASLVKNPLPIEFTVAENGSTQVVAEVLLVDQQATPSSFGYASFGFTIVVPQGNTVTDIDGNIYHTVTIGTQVWMVENLKVTKYNDGTPISHITDPVLWNGLTTAGYCWYENNSNYKSSSYGAIYNWYAVNSQKLAPQGWHVPTTEEWQTLVDFAGGNSTAATKLKETGLAHWSPSTVPATNDYGFTAVGAGIRGNNGIFGNMTLGAYFWHANDENTWGGAVTYMQQSGDVYLWKPFNKEMGVSVRCIKD